MSAENVILKGSRRAARWLAGVALAMVGSVGNAQATVPAAIDAVLQSEACRVVEPFYWEIGTASGPLYSGSQGRDAPGAHTVMPIASATKWLFAAYVVQKRKGQLTSADIAALTMQSGYTHFKFGACVRLLESRRAQQTVGECFSVRGNDGFTAQHQNKYFYNGGHFQHLGISAFGLKDLNNATLADEIERGLGLPMDITFNSPQVAGGVAMSAADYARFLRAMLQGQVLLGAQLGAHAVCTRPSSCPTAIYTPVAKDKAWDYSLGHWVESDPRTGDGAFSSAGAFGFYPWIDAGKRYYGVIARDKRRRGPAPESAECGRRLRSAVTTTL